MYGTPNGEIPSVGKVDLAWVQTPLPPVNLSPSNNHSSSAAASSGGKTDQHMEGVHHHGATGDENDARGATESSATHGQDGGGAHGGAHAQDQQHVEEDYDVADDNDWGLQ